MTWWNDYVGIPFKMQGRDREGVDCWGLVRLVYQERFSVVLPEYLTYDSTRAFKQIDELVQTGKREWNEVPRAEIKDFDLVVLKIGDLSPHVGIVCDDSKHFLHALEGANSVIEKLSGLRWGGRIDSFWRL